MQAARARRPRPAADAPRSAGSRRRRGRAWRRAGRARCASARARGGVSSRTPGAWKVSSRSGASSSTTERSALGVADADQPERDAREEAPVGARQALEVGRGPDLLQRLRRRSAGRPSAPSVTAPVRRRPRFRVSRFDDRRPLGPLAAIARRRAAPHGRQQQRASGDGDPDADHVGSAVHVPEATRGGRARAVASPLADIQRAWPTPRHADSAAAPRAVAELPSTRCRRARRSSPGAGRSLSSRARPLERIGEHPARRLAREAPRLCAQVLARAALRRGAGATDRRGAASGRERSAPGAGAWARWPARGRRGAVDAVEALRGVLWEALLEELRARRPRAVRRHGRPLATSARALWQPPLAAIEPAAPPPGTCECRAARGAPATSSRGRAGERDRGGRAEPALIVDEARTSARCHRRPLGWRLRAESPREGPSRRSR